MAPGDWPRSFVSPLARCSIPDGGYDILVGGIALHSQEHTVRRCDPPEGHGHSPPTPRWSPRFQATGVVVDAPWARREEPLEESAGENVLEAVVVDMLPRVEEPRRLGGDDSTFEVSRQSPMALDHPPH